MIIAQPLETAQLPLRASPSIMLGLLKDTLSWCTLQPRVPSAPITAPAPLGLHWGNSSIKRQKCLRDSECVREERSKRDAFSSGFTRASRRIRLNGETLRQREREREKEREREAQKWYHFPRNAGHLYRLMESCK
ncbi:hypothetical protein JZ751_004192 [Albula glossodonta]|uniref:Uncharacterized protein n=1 Tax=Albula glossodonta TaxID=121402 RepID=A0A8T2N648_9TELE|nr:hypothetical protein JZ751_004192 [Albula glossodonta]